MKYNDPAGGTPSSIGPQHITAFHLKKAIVTARKEQYFTQLADVKNMPKNFGKTMNVFEYIPLLDARNVNDQGLDAAGATIANGNLYGSSKDIGTIMGKLPTLTENGGRVNRVGFTRILREGSIHKMGFFTEFTQEQLDFDSDEELFGHISTELLNGAVQISEALLQKDLLLSAGTVVYSGAATSNATMTAEGATPSVVDYKLLSRLDQILNDNRTPKQTKVITGSRLIDTRTIASGRVMYIGSELQWTFETMKDPFGNQAFIPVQKYADAGNVLEGEIGTVGHFRIIVVPEMLSWAGAGAAVTANPGYRATNNKYDVFPMLVVGDDSFSTIGFQTDGKTVKFKITTKMPGEATADRNDPYGEMGFSSIKWYYGTLVYRPERLALAKSVATI
ncbi:N4-gp56 family major capsid protein [Dyella sp. ASV21]|uniref:N4-gp56 family major capsid protein n=1 Tax=Dyella sp. ASV21 TaxID=2795114 RepID=UPI0018EE0570|nr:N4-gp56 family major capsid protein [Dyella sp. ASV21]